MASVVWSGGHGCGKMGFCRGEEVLLGHWRRAELHRQWLGSGGCGDGHVGRRRGGSGRPAEEEEEEMWASDGEPTVRKNRAFTVSGDMEVRRIAERTSPLEGDQLPGMVASEEQVGPLMQAEEKVVREKSSRGDPDDAPAESSRNRTFCSVSWDRAARRVADRVLPVKGAQRPMAGDKPAEVETERTPALRKKRRVARRTLPVNVAPLKKVAPVDEQACWGRHQDPGELEKREVVEEGAQLPMAGDKPAEVVERTLALRKKRRVARRTLPVDVSPLKKATAGDEKASWRRHQDPGDSEEGEAVEVGAAASRWADREGSGQEEAACMLLQSSRSVDAYELLNKIGEGSYGVVFRARDRETGEIVALKKVKMDTTTLREISILASLRHHPCIVGLKEVVSDVGGPEDGVFTVMEYAEYDLRRVIDGMNRRFSESEVKFLVLQLLRGIQCIHSNGVLHRDLKTSNLLLTRCGDLKVCDFGLSRHCGGDNVGEQRQYSDRVGTLWYKAPELLLRAEGYSAAIDMWSAGCVMAELLGKAPLFQGRDVLDQLHQIFSILGTPDEGTWPGFTALCAQTKVSFSRQPCSLRKKLPLSSLSEAGYDLLMGLLRYDPSRRTTIQEALNHDWFRKAEITCDIACAY